MRYSNSLMTSKEHAGQLECSLPTLSREREVAALPTSLLAMVFKIWLKPSPRLLKLASVAHALNFQ